MAAFRPRADILRKAKRNEEATSILLAQTSRISDKQVREYNFFHSSSVHANLQKKFPCRRDIPEVLSSNICMVASHLWLFVIFFLSMCGQMLEYYLKLGPDRLSPRLFDVSIPRACSSLALHEIQFSYPSNMPRSPLGL
jgi:hypothetical protein